MTRLAVRFAALLTLALALAPSAGARGMGGPIPYHAANGAPTSLHAFLLRPDEAAQSYYPRTPSFTWNPVSTRGGTYEFELATSRTFDDSVILFRYSKLRIPALSVDHQLPWMTGSPYALWAHVRWVSNDGKKVSRWSDPLGFNMRWRDTEYPTQQDAPPGMVRWSPIEGATGYEVLYTDIHPAASFTTTTNVADEREYFTLHDSLGWGGSVHWRVRAIRFINDKDVLVNGLPRVTYGPWSKSFTSVNPPKSLGTLNPSATVSDTWDKPGHAVRAHDLTPGFAWSASAPAVTDIAVFGSSLYRVYISTDDQCVNRVFTGSVVGSPAFAPRTTGGPSALPQSTKTLAKWMSGETGQGTEGRSYDATGKDVVPNETPGASVSGGGAGATSTGPVAAAGVDLWDSGWPTGRYYWTVVPVTVEFKIPTDPTSTDPAIEYHDTAVAQDSCQSGFGMSFGKVSEPVVTRDGAPFVSGLTPSGRVVASAGRNPKVHDSPLVAWLPAVGATSYELELSRKLYPWKAAKSLATYATSAVLPLAKSDNGAWYYRVRGVNPALPAGAQKMSWSKPVKIHVTGDQFIVVSK